MLATVLIVVIIKNKSTSVCKSASFRNTQDKKIKKKNKKLGVVYST